MTVPVATTPSRHHRRIFGLRRVPGRLALWVFRSPLRLYRRGWGWMLGHTFLMFDHVGRRTGATHQAVAMVLSEDKTTGEVVIVSGWGPNVDWMRNLRARRAEKVTIGRTHFTPVHRFLSEDEAVAVALAFRRHHRARMRLVTTILGWGRLDDDASIRTFVRDHPMVAFRPALNGPATARPSTRGAPGRHRGRR